MSPRMGDWVEFRLPDMNMRPRHRPALVTDTPIGEGLCLTAFLGGEDCGEGDTFLAERACREGSFLVLIDVGEGVEVGDWRHQPGPTYGEMAHPGHHEKLLD